AKVGPRVFLERGHSRRGVQHREIGRADSLTEFMPFEGHGNGGAWPGSCGIRGYGGGATLIAEGVDKYRAASLGFGDRGDVTIGTVGSHGVGERLRESLDLRPGGLGLDWSDHVEAFASGCFYEGVEA